MRVVAAGVPSVVGVYAARDARAQIPEGFARVCEQMRWDTKESWLKLSDQKLPWFLAENGRCVRTSASGARVRAAAWCLLRIALSHRACVSALLTVLRPDCRRY